MIEIQWRNGVSRVGIISIVDVKNACLGRIFVVRWKQKSYKTFSLHFQKKKTKHETFSSQENSWVELLI